jgi:F-type H+-transporting ATPase subunit delta
MVPALADPILVAALLPPLLIASTPSSTRLPNTRCYPGRFRDNTQIRPTPSSERVHVAADDSMMASVAGRYASALYDLATEQNQVKAVEQELAGMQAMLDESTDLRRMVLSPVFTADEQTKALTAVLAKAGVGPLTSNFLKLIAKNRRLFALSDMIKNYRSLAARGRGEAQAEVTSAIALTEPQLAALRDNLRAAAGGKDVQVTTKVDPALLGGLIVKMGSRMVDSSIRTKLTSLKTAMKEVG